MSAYRIRAVTTLCGMLCCLVVTACDTDKLVEVAAPETGVDPALFKTAQGAQMLYNKAVTSFNGMFMGGESAPVVWVTSMFTDEVTHRYRFGNNRIEPEPITAFSGERSTQTPQYYRELHAARLSVEQAIGPMQQYAPLSPKALTGQLFALGGYVVTWFGEQFCAGVPLSTLVYEGDVIYGDPLTTQQLHLSALARFDSALAYAADSARILNLARVGRGRAFLNLGRFADAAVAVKDVPTSFSYQVTVSAPGQDNHTFRNVFATQTPDSPEEVSGYSVGDREGINGLNYVSANDPRVRTEPQGDDGSTHVPVDRAWSSPIVLASGVEARLIEAEAALQANDIAGWAAKLNAARATCAASNPACPAPIAPLTADSTTAASAALRVDVMFRERAF